MTSFGFFGTFNVSSDWTRNTLQYTQYIYIYKLSHSHLGFLTVTNSGGKKTKKMPQEIKLKFPLKKLILQVSVWAKKNALYTSTTILLPSTTTSWQLHRL